jgi:small-conductance mechanosensitive channel/CRP-like cAMP-binding protein
MSDVVGDSAAAWAAVFVIVLPLVIIGTGELEERLRQRDSPLRQPVAILRTWVLPLFAVWSLSRVVFETTSSNPIVRLIGSALVVATGAAALAALAIVVDRIRNRPSDGRRSVPRLLLAFPRLILVIVIVWTLVAGIWEVNLSAALTALGVTSLVISFALQDTLGGIASGFTLLADHPFQPGDWIRADDVEGRVVDTNWRSSRIETRNGDLVIVPNGKLAGATITNYDEPTRLHRIVFPVQVAFVNAPTDAKEMLLAAARSTPGVLADPPPNAVVVQVDDPLMGYEVHLWIDDYTIAPRVRSDFGSLVWYHSHRHNVPLPSPAQDLYLWDGVRTAESGRRDHASMLSGLRRSVLLDQLDDDELDELSGGATSTRFARGETILTHGSDDLVLIESGSAQLVLHTDRTTTQSVLEVTAGDLVSSLGGDETRGHEITLRATSDCDVIVLDADAAGGVISRSPALNTALEQVRTSRRRRVHRVLRRLAEERAAHELGVVAFEGPTEGTDPEEVER